MMFYTDEYIDKNYPEHQRTSCSDNDRMNASVDGHGCHRCNALEFKSLELLREYADKFQMTIGKKLNDTRSK